MANTGPDKDTPMKVGPGIGDLMPAGADPRLGEITVDHLLTMRAGLQRTSGPNSGRWVTSDDWVRHVLSRPFVADWKRTRARTSAGSEPSSLAQSQPRTC
jgi:CubicO group peptidase (beta-lactamase class C family)